MKTKSSCLVSLAVLLVGSLSVSADEEFSPAVKVTVIQEGLEGEETSRSTVSAKRYTDGDFLGSMPLIREGELALLVWFVANPKSDELRVTISDPLHSRRGISDGSSFVQPLELVDLRLPIAESGEYTLLETKEFRVRMIVRDTWEKPDQAGAEDGKRDEPKDDDFVGLSKDEAIALAKKRGLKWRVVSEDGQPFPVTKDLRPDRVNFAVEDGKVRTVKRG